MPFGPRVHYRVHGKTSGQKRGQNTGAGGHERPRAKTRVAPGGKKSASPGFNKATTPFALPWFIPRVSRVTWSPAAVHKTPSVALPGLLRKSTKLDAAYPDRVLFVDAGDHPI